MKLSNHTPVLKNFATINQNLVIKEGNELLNVFYEKYSCKSNCGEKNFQKNLQYMI